MQIVKEELQFDDSLKKRLEFICEFSKVTPTFINGSIRKIDKTNISYIEPHRVIVKDTTFLVFNYSNDVYVSNLYKKIKLSESEDYINSIKLKILAKNHDFCYNLVIRNLGGSKLLWIKLNFEEEYQEEKILENF